MSHSFHNHFTYKNWGEKVVPLAPTPYLLWRVKTAVLAALMTPMALSLGSAEAKPTPDSEVPALEKQSVFNKRLVDQWIRYLQENHTERYKALLNAQSLEQFELFCLESLVQLWHCTSKDVISYFTSNKELYTVQRFPKEPNPDTIPLWASWFPDGESGWLVTVK